MRRREFITLLVGATADWPLAARAQQSGRIPRIGVLWAEANADQAAPMLDGLRQGLGELTYFDGQTIKLENRFAGQHYDRFDALAAERREQGRRFGCLCNRGRHSSKAGHKDDSYSLRIR